MIEGFLRRTIFHNTVLDYLISIGIFMLGFIIITFVKRIYLQRIKGWAEKNKNSADDFIVNTVEKRVLPLAYFGLFYICMHGLNLKPLFCKGLDIIGLLFTIVIGCYHYFG